VCAGRNKPAASAALAERLILVIAEDSRVLVEIIQTAEAKVLAAGNQQDALELARLIGFSSAILDIPLSDHDCSAICRELSLRTVPFMFYVGRAGRALAKQWPHAPVVVRPTRACKLVSTLALLMNQPYVRAARNL
jgi:hypothetical protein